MAKTWTDPEIPKAIRQAFCTTVITGYTPNGEELKRFVCDIDKLGPFDELWVATNKISEWILGCVLLWGQLTEKNFTALIASMSSTGGYSGVQRLPKPRNAKHLEEIKESAWCKVLCEKNETFKQYGSPPADVEMNIPWIMIVKGKSVVHTHQSYPFSTMPHWISNVQNTIWILAFPITMVETLELKNTLCNAKANIVKKWWDLQKETSADLCAIWLEVKKDQTAWIPAGHVVAIFNNESSCSKLLIVPFASARAIGSMSPVVKKMIIDQGCGGLEEGSTAGTMFSSWKSMISRSNESLQTEST